MCLVPRGHGQVQFPGHCVKASSAQMESHCVSQQNGSSPHTQLWQTKSWQPRPPLAMQQLPEDTGAHGQLPAHAPAAALAHRPSHCVSQQNGSAPHTHVSHVVLAQPGVPLAAQQSPVHPPHWSDSPWQMLSHWVAQQKGSRAQTQAWMARSAHPGVPWARQQEPAPGQSPGQVATVSTPSQRPLPQIGPPHPGQLPAQPPAPEQAATPPVPVAQPAHRLSQPLSQQNGSKPHTQVSHEETPQPGVPLAAQQSPVHDPH
jgi:hypothetical protein